MWNDLELYHDYRDFTTDPEMFPAEEMRNFIRELVRRSLQLGSVNLIGLFRMRMSNTVCPLLRLTEHAFHQKTDIPIVHGYAALLTNDTDVVRSSSWRMQAGY